MEPTAGELSRVRRTKGEARAHYDRRSRWYDLLEGRWEETPRRTGLEALAVGAGERVLEVGVGTGHGLLALARRVGEGGRVYGFDLSSRMLEKSRRRLEGAGLAGRVELAAGDAVRLPFPDGFFDSLFMSFTLEFFDTPEIPGVLADCRRVLRPGGRMGVVALSKEALSALAERLYEWLHQHFPRWLDCRPIYPQEALEQAGFQILTTGRWPEKRSWAEIVVGRRSLLP